MIKIYRNSTIKNIWLYENSEADKANNGRELAVDSWIVLIAIQKRAGVSWICSCDLKYTNQLP